MKIGISRKTVDDAEARQLVECCLSYGYEGIQYKTNQMVPWAFDPAALLNVHPQAGRLAAAGLVFHPGADFSVWPALISVVGRFAVGVGARQVVWVFKPTADQGHTLPKVAEELLRTGEKFKKLGLDFSFHNRIASIIESPSAVQDLCERLDPEICGLTLDTAHAAKGGFTDISRSIVDLFRYIRVIHLKDVDASGNFCPLGGGTLDLIGILKALASKQFDRWLIVDEETKGLSCEDACSLSANYLESHGVVMRHASVKGQPAAQSSGP